MLQTLKNSFIILLGVVISSCESSETVQNGETISNEQITQELAWSISESKVLGPYNPFPLVTTASFTPINTVSYQDNHPTTLISLGPTELRAYPNSFIGLYEVINNEFENKKYAITHCPQTSSTIAWDRTLNNKVITLKASGYLYNDNLMPIDIETNSIWSQMLIRGVRGQYDYVSPNTFNVVETDWKTVKDKFPTAKVYNEQVNSEVVEYIATPGSTNRDYFRYGIISGIANVRIHIFKYELFQNLGLTLFNTTITGKKVLVIGNEERNFVSSYYIDSKRTYRVSDKDSFLFEDDLGNVYNAMGLVIDGPKKNMQLDSPKAYTAAWQSWQDFYDDFVFYE